MSATPWTLRYVCKMCGCLVAEFPNVPSHEPNTIGLCDRAECRTKASAEWKAA